MIFAEGVGGGGGTPLTEKSAKTFLTASLKEDGVQ